MVFVQTECTDSFLFRVDANVDKTVENISVHETADPFDTGNSKIEIVDLAKNGEQSSCCIAIQYAVSWVRPKALIEILLRRKALIEIITGAAVTSCIKHPWG